MDATGADARQLTGAAHGRDHRYFPHVDLQQREIIALADPDDLRWQPLLGVREDHLKRFAVPARCAPRACWSPAFQSV